MIALMASSRNRISGTTTAKTVGGHFDHVSLSAGLQLHDTILYYKPHIPGFSVERVKFSFPEPSTGDTAASTDISDVEVGLLDDQWRAIHPVRDDAKKFCGTLRTTLGNMPLAGDSKRFVLQRFQKYVRSDEAGPTDRLWLKNPSEVGAQVSALLVPHEFELTPMGKSKVLLYLGIFNIYNCPWKYDQSFFC